MMQWNLTPMTQSVQNLPPMTQSNQTVKADSTCENSHPMVYTQFEFGVK